METKEFSKLLISFPDSVNNRAKLQALLADLFPNDRALIRLLIMAHEIGIVEEIKRNSLDTAFANRMVQRLEDDYAIDSKKAQQVVCLWCEAYGRDMLKKGYSVHFISNQAQPTVSQVLTHPQIVTTSYTSPSGIQWRSDNTIKVQPPKYPKKITGTRLPDILGLNPFKTPFQVWCAITKTYEAPFVDNQFTKAGKVIQPKQFDFAKSRVSGSGISFATPVDVFGPNPFKTTYGDFFKSTDSTFGGMWDYLIRKNSQTIGVFEMKTTNVKNEGFWRRELPDMNTLQAALYAWLLHIDQIYMVSTFLSDQNYQNPYSFNCSDKNTMITPFSLHSKYPNFERDYIAPARAWWQQHVVTGISPAYDEQKDADILAELRRK